MRLPRSSPLTINMPLSVLFPLAGASGLKDPTPRTVSALANVLAGLERTGKKGVMRRRKQDQGSRAESLTESIVITESGRLTRSKSIKVGDEVVILGHHSIQGLEGKTGSVTKVWTNNKTHKEWIKVKLKTEQKVVNVMSENCERGDNDFAQLIIQEPVKAECSLRSPAPPSRINESNPRSMAAEMGSDTKAQKSDIFSFGQSSHLATPIHSPDAKAKIQRRGLKGASSLGESLAAISITPRVAESTESLDWSDGSDSSRYDMEDDGRFKAGVPVGTPRTRVTASSSKESCAASNSTSTAAASKRDYKSLRSGGSVLGNYHKNLSVTSHVTKYKRKHKKLINQYEIGKLLGEGAFASVRKAFDIAASRYCAVKKMAKSRLRKDLGSSNHSELTKVRAGLLAVYPLSHPHLLKIFEIMDSPKLDSLYIVLEFAGSGQIMSFDSSRKQYYSDLLGTGPLGGIKLTEVKRIMLEALSAIQYMHSVKVTHGDIKPDNLLLDSQLNVKLSDFGSARSHDGEKEALVANGTYAFWSPEMAGADGNSEPYSDDVWALSVTLYCMAFGDPPFYIINPVELFGHITKVQITPPKRLPEPTHPSVKELYDLLNGSLCLDKQKRLQLHQIAKHSFLRSTNTPESTEVAKTLSNSKSRLSSPGEQR